MGVADAMGPISDAVKNAYQISAVMSTLLSFFVFIAFAIFSIPGGLLAARIGKKNLLLLGLALNVVAVLVPTVWSPQYVILLGCIFLLGVGTTFLQVSGNPIMRDVSDEGQYARNLSFAQGFKGIGSAGATLVPVIVLALIPVLEKTMGWRVPFPIYLALMVITLVSVATLNVKETRADVPPSVASCLSLLTQPVFLLAVIGIFLYVGAEVSMGRFLKPTLIGMIAPAFKNVEVEKLTDPTAIKQYKAAADLAHTLGPFMFLLALAIGRIFGGFVLMVLSPKVFFRLSALLGLLGAAIFMTDVKWLSFAGVVAAGLGFANIWPLLFSITVEERPERANELSGLMCMAISGGAIVPLVMGQLMDWDFGAFAFIVPTVCFVYLLLLSLRGGRAMPAKQ
jgi:MFS transporter, FHS family, L-fucose permease